MYPSWLTGTKLETTGNARQIAIQNVKINHVLIGIAVGDKVLVHKEGILCKSESKYEKDPWTVSQVHTNGAIRIQRGTKSERLNVRRVTPFLRKLKHNKSQHN
jgi:hypothetical protein